MPINRTVNFFLKMAAWILFATGAAKVASAFGHTLILTETDPLLHFSYRQLLLILGIVETALAVYLYLGRNSWNRTISLLLLSGNFLLYRFGLLLIGGGPSCPCLGSMAEWLGLSADFVSYLAASISGVFFGGSLASLFKLRAIELPREVVEYGE
jgi:hypothetical protein